MSDAPAADWYTDPSGRHELRYWDGERWTEHVADRGQQGVDPPTDAATSVAPAGGHVPTVNRAGWKVREDVAKAGAGDPSAVGGGTLFTEPVLVVNQKAKFIEVNNEYAVYDQHANQIGAARQVGQSKLKKFVRVIGDVDQFLTHRLELVDMAGNVQLAITRPAKVFKSRVQVEDGAGRAVGEIVQQNMIGKIRFSLEAGGTTVGSLQGENWRAWNFGLQDETGTEVARITKTWEGLAKTMFTTADNYVVRIHRPLADPLRSLVVAAALAVDTALKQDSRGLS